MPFGFSAARASPDRCGGWQKVKIDRSKAANEVREFLARMRLELRPTSCGYDARRSFQQSERDL